jgi:hypothetical protein
VLTDGDRIRNLLGRYCELIDAGDFGGVGALFAHGRITGPDGAELARGADAVAAYLASAARLHGGSPRTKHLVLDTVLDPDGESAVTARSSYVVLQAVEGLVLQPIITGRYLDRFERDGAEWHFAARRFLVDLVGDLGQHLRFDVDG